MKVTQHLKYKFHFGFNELKFDFDVDAEGEQQAKDALKSALQSMISELNN